MIQIEWATKYFGEKLALDAVAFEAQPGEVTALVGPNGAGKTTLFRCLLGLDRLDAGEVLIDGKPYAAIKNPGRHIGVMLDGIHGHPGRTAYQQLRAQSLAIGVSKARVYEVLQMVGLDSVATKRIGTFSLGMKQRLSLASAVLGNPGVLILDEPLNGLDSDGIRWMRRLVRQFANEGHTVLLASHLMSEVQQTANHLVVMARGTVLADMPVASVLGHRGVTVAVTEPGELHRMLTAAGLAFIQNGDEFTLTGANSAQVGLLAKNSGLTLTHLTDIFESVEDAYLRITEGAADYSSERSGDAQPN